MIVILILDSKWLHETAVVAGLSLTVIIIIIISRNKGMHVAKPANIVCISRKF